VFPPRPVRLCRRWGAVRGHGHRDGHGGGRHWRVRSGGAGRQAGLNWNVRQAQLRPLRMATPPANAIANCFYFFTNSATNCAKSFVTRGGG
jgi:hypothetical protein